MRRLRRICAHYGSDPVFIASSATIGNPAELAERAHRRAGHAGGRGRQPARAQALRLLEPAAAWTRAGGERRSANVEAKDLLLRLVKQGRQTICFARTRVSSELIYRYARDALLREAPHLAQTHPRLPRRLPARGAPRDRARALQRRAAGRVQHQRAGAGHRHRQPRRGASSWASAARSPAPGSRPGAPGRGRRESCAVLVALQRSHRPVPACATRTTSSGRTPSRR